MREPLGLILAEDPSIRMDGISKADFILGRATLLTHVQARLESLHACCGGVNMLIWL